MVSDSFLLKFPSTALQSFHFRFVFSRSFPFQRRFALCSCCRRGHIFRMPAVLPELQSGSRFGRPFNKLGHPWAKVSYAWDTFTDHSCPLPVLCVSLSLRELEFQKPLPFA